MCARECMRVCECLYVCKCESVCASAVCVCVCVCACVRVRGGRPHSQCTWAPAGECLLVAIIEEVGWGSLSSFSLFSSRKVTREFLMSTTSSISASTRFSASCSSALFSESAHTHTHSHEHTHAHTHT